jgi:hypothetical protein
METLPVIRSLKPKLRTIIKLNGRPVRASNKANTETTTFPPTVTGMTV